MEKTLYFFKEMDKRSVKHLLDAQLDSHLDNEKGQKSTTRNYGNGHGAPKERATV